MNYLFGICLYLRYILNERDLCKGNIQLIKQCKRWRKIYFKMVENLLHDGGNFLQDVGNLLHVGGIHTSRWKKTYFS
jgi:hypothetical protein